MNKTRVINEVITALGNYTCMYIHITNQEIDFYICFFYNKSASEPFVQVKSGNSLTSFKTQLHKGFRSRFDKKLFKIRRHKISVCFEY